MAAGDHSWISAEVEKLACLHWSFQAFRRETNFMFFTVSPQKMNVLSVWNFGGSFCQEDEVAENSVTLSAARPFLCNPSFLFLFACFVPCCFIDCISVSLPDVTCSNHNISSEWFLFFKQVQTVSSLAIKLGNQTSGYLFTLAICKRAT